MWLWLNYFLASFFFLVFKGFWDYGSECLKPWSFFCYIFFCWIVWLKKFFFKLKKIMLHSWSGNQDQTLGKSDLVITYKASFLLAVCGGWGTKRVEVIPVIGKRGTILTQGARYGACYFVPAQVVLLVLKCFW